MDKVPTIARCHSEGCLLPRSENTSITAQKNYFDSIVAWNGTMDHDIENFDPNNNANLDQWRAMNFNVKNRVYHSKIT